MRVQVHLPPRPASVPATSERPQPRVFLRAGKHSVAVGPQDVIALPLNRQHVPIAEVLLPAVRHLRRLPADGERMLKLPGVVQAGGALEQDFGDGGSEGQTRKFVKPSHLPLRLEGKVLVPHQQVSARGETGHYVVRERTERCLECPR